MRNYPLLLALIVGGCGGEPPQNAAEIANASAPEAEPNASDELPTPANGSEQLQPAMLSVGALQVPYNKALLSPVTAKLPLPPDWKRSVQATKLVGRDRAELIGKAECLYGQSGQASRCNAEQEAGLAFAELPVAFEQASAEIPTDQRKAISLAGTEGLSWEIGAEGEGAEYILLPSGEGTLLIVRQFRTSGNPDEQALGTVLTDMRLRD